MADSFYSFKSADKLTFTDNGSRAERLSASAIP